MAEEQAVQDNTESASEAGVYGTTTQQASPIDPGVQEAVEQAAKPVDKQAEPMKYDFKFPEGIEIDKKAVAAFIPIMQKLNIPPEAAQQIVDIQANMAKEAMKAHETAVETARNKWVDEITKDTKLGGEKLKETIHVANQALDKVGTEGFKALLKRTGLGDHPEVIRLFHKVGQMLGDDKSVFGGPSVNAGIGTMYENSPDMK
jgi:hypothetical protein